MQVWPSFESAIDAYINGWNEEPLGKREMECNHGCITFHKYPNNGLDTITLFGIFIYKNDRRQGHCRKILEHLVDVFLLHGYDFMIESVLSKPLFDYLSRFQYKGCSFTIQKTGFLLRQTTRLW
jgi:hypothetical protein